MAKVEGSDVDYSPVDLLKIVLKSIGKNVERKVDWDYWKLFWSVLDTPQKKEFLVNSIRGSKAKVKVVRNLSKYIRAKLPETIPYGIKESIDKAYEYAKSPLSMTKAGTVGSEYETGIEEMVSAAFDVAGLAMIPGHGVTSGSVVGSGIRRQTAKNIKHTLSEETLKKIADSMKVDTSDIKGVSGKILAELETQTPKSKGFGNVKKVALSTAPVSPKNIYKYEKSGSGNLIYRTMNLADQGLNRFGGKVVREFKKAAGNIKAGSPSSLKIGKALDAKDEDVSKLVGELSKSELKLYNYLKDQFDFLINKYARSALGTPERYKKIANAVNATKKPMVDVKDLDRGLKSQYDKIITVKNLFLQRFGGNSVSNLSKKNKKLFEKMQESLDEIRYKGWVKSLDQAEKDVYSLLKRKIKNYLPHIFDRNELLKGFSDEMDVQRLGLRKATNPKEVNKIKKRMIVLQSNIDKIKGGELITYEQLPKSLRFGSFQPRKGAMGYGFDAVKAYGTYARGIADKIYKEPALRKIKVLYKDLSPEYKQYAFKHVNEWVGKKRTGAENLADWLTTTQWSLKLGANPRSAMQNVLQRVNTLAVVGEKNATIGYLKGWTKEGKKLFEESGLREEVPEVLLEGKIPKPLKLVKATLGKMFTMAEVGNRKHAFLSGLEQAKKKGLKGKEATQYAIDLVHQTQFRYGTVGLPAPLRNPIGRVAFQFSSYPIKQTEFLLGLLKNDPKALLRWVAYAEGGKRLVEDETGWELGTAMGTGIDFGEVVEAVKQVPEKDWDNFLKHGKLALSGGNVIPGIGPTIGAATKIAEGAKNYRGIDAFLEEIKPVQYKKGEKLYKGIKAAYDTEEGIRLPQFDSRGYLNQDLTSGEAFTTFFGPNLKKVTDLSKKKSLKFENSRIEKSLQRDLNKAIAEGDIDTSIDLGMKLFNFGGYEKGAIGRNIPWEDREMMGKTSRDYLLDETLFK